MHFGSQRSCAWQGLYRGECGITKFRELLAPKCSLGALGAHWVPELAGWLAGWLRQGLRQGQGLRHGRGHRHGQRQGSYRNWSEYRSASLITNRRRTGVPAIRPSDPISQMADRPIRIPPTDPERLASISKCSSMKLFAFQENVAFRKMLHSPVWHRGLVGRRA